MSFSVFYQRFIAPIRKPVLSLLHAIDCIIYIVVLLSLFIFISMLSTKGQQSNIYLDNILFIILIFQLFRVLCTILMEKSLIFLKDISFFLILLVIYWLSQRVEIKQYMSIDFVFEIHTIVQIIYLLIYLVIGFKNVSDFLRSIRMNFLYSFTFGFIFLIFFGTWLLSLPICRTVDISITDLLFTATSAITITGFNIIDISHDLTRVGQVMLMLLVQLGGLGIMTFSTLYVVTLTSRLSFEERMYTVQLFAVKNIQDISDLLKWIFISTILIEIVGAIFIYIGTLSSLNMTDLHRLFFAIFHSVMSYCNAGLTLSPTGVRYFFDNPTILYTISILAILGGLGFATQLEITKSITRWRPWKRKKVNNIYISMSSQSKLIITMSSILLILGTVLFYIFNSHDVMRNFTTSEKINNSFFQSAVIRTAGFQNLSLMHFTHSTILMFMILMFIGTAPSSMGGGIKITTFFVLLWTALKVLCHQSYSERPFLGFNFSVKLIGKAGLVLFLRLTVLMIGVFLVSCFDPHLPLFGILFECLSALSTAGLSLNITPLLSSESKGVLMILMFIGRVGAFYLLSNILPLQDKKSSLKRKEQNISLE